MVADSVAELVFDLVSLLIFYGVGFWLGYRTGVRRVLTGVVVTVIRQRDGEHDRTGLTPSEDIRWQDITEHEKGDHGQH